MMKDEITGVISDVLKPLAGGVDFSVEISAESAHGEYASNCALVGAKKLKKNPKKMADEISAELSKKLPDGVERIEVAGPGFINFFLKRAYFSETVADILKKGKKYGHGDVLKGEKVMVEYTDPNPFKEFHIGHLMSNTIGESIARLFEAQSAEVRRACYQGDVGLHVAKAMWGMQSSPEHDNQPLNKLGVEAQVRYLGHAYKLGAAAYEDGRKDAIEELNRKIYDRSDGAVNKLYDWGRKISLEYFETIYARLGTKFDFYFFESEMAKPGMKIVREFLKKGIFEESEKAIVFRAEKHNKKLHTRVFITSQGLPTYEAKELGLHFAKAKKYSADVSVVVTASEQDGVFAVGLEALRQIDKGLASRIRHLSHGMLRLPSGKMSSRTGDVITAEQMLSEIEKLIEDKMKERGYGEKLKKEIVESVSVGALKYSILRQAIGGDIVFDFDKSVSFDGDSGPYLQYSATRAKSVLQKAREMGVLQSYDISYDLGSLMDWQTAPFERQLLYFPEIVERAQKENAPHLVVTYLTELAGAFNSFYAKEKIADKNDPHSPYKLALTSAFRTVMENGLWILGIKVPSRM